jgi:hypothetical protein
MNNYALGNFRKLNISQEEDLKRLQFSETDVLTKGEDLRTRGANLDKAGVFSNHPKIKVFITLKDINGDLFKFQAFVYNNEDGMVVLKSGLRIPVKTIFSVDFF